MMIEVPPSTLQKASWFFELSSVPFLDHGDLELAQPDRLRDDVGVGAEEHFLDRLGHSGDVGRKYPATHTPQTDQGADNLTGAQASPHRLLQAG